MKKPDFKRALNEMLSKPTSDKTQAVMSQWQVIDIMTFNPYGLQYYSFRKGKIGFARTVPVFLDNANSHQALQYNNITVSKNDFLRYRRYGL